MWVSEEHARVVEQLRVLSAIHGGIEDEDRPRCASDESAPGSDSAGEAPGQPNSLERALVRKVILFLSLISNMIFI